MKTLYAFAHKVTGEYLTTNTEASLGEYGEFEHQQTYFTSSSNDQIWVTPDVELARRVPTKSYIGWGDSDRPSIHDLDGGTIDLTRYTIVELQPRFAIELTPVEG